MTTLWKLLGCIGCLGCAVLLALKASTIKILMRRGNSSQNSIVYDGPWGGTTSSLTTATASENLYHLKKKSGIRPLSIISHGCSGSSAVVQLTRELIGAHGLSVTKGDSELTKPEKNSYYESAKEKLRFNGEDAPQAEIILKAMTQTIKASKEQDKTLIFKIDPNRFKDDLLLVSGLRDLGVKFVHFYRRNYLDRALCQVRDCFPGGATLGYSVFASNGTRTNLCFKRRKARINVKAVIDPAAIIKYLHYSEQTQKKENDTFVIQLFTETDEKFAYEDLYAFEYSRDKTIFDKSLVLWTKLLTQFIDNPNQQVVTKIMNRYQGSLKRNPHSELILNFDEVVAALKDANLDHWLRYSDKEAK